MSNAIWNSFLNFYNITKNLLLLVPRSVKDLSITFSSDRFRLRLSCQDKLGIHLVYFIAFCNSWHRLICKIWRKVKTHVEKITYIDLYENIVQNQKLQNFHNNFSIIILLSLCIVIILLYFHLLLERISGIHIAVYETFEFHIIFHSIREKKH